MATACLDGSINFIRMLLSFMSETYRLFTRSKFAEDVSWHLVTKLVHHIFAEDMGKVRSFVRDAMHTMQKREMGAAVLWGTFRTHAVMQEYIQFNIEHHPSISSEYVKFLVVDCGEMGALVSAALGTESGSDGGGGGGAGGGGGKVASLESKVNALSRSLSTMKEKQASTQNELKQLKDKLNK